MIHKKSYLCSVCDEVEFNLVCEKLDFQYVSCSCCGVVRQYPYPDENVIEDYYKRYVTKKTAKSVYLTDNGFSQFEFGKKLTFKDLNLSENIFDNKVVLDVGCGTGQFVSMINNTAKSIIGIDLSEECIQFAVKRGLNCKKANFLDIKEKVDIITMWHLIEHLRNPKEFIKHAYDLLNFNGILLIETPVIGSISFSFGKDWRFFMPVEHINLFTQNALFSLAIQCGFIVKSWVRFGSGNDSGALPAANKRAMDSVAKQKGFGDTIAVLLIKNDK
jgi:2-polyprenyl-3-methyl-5-hydroxy-6-metoxy-1,4-benzoquinol methylase